VLVHHQRFWPRNRYLPTDVLVVVFKHIIVDKKNLYGDHRTETGIEASPFPHGDYLLPYRDLKQVNPCFHMGIPIWKWGLTHPHFHMGTIQFLTRFHMMSVTIWELRKKSPYENKFPFGFTVSIW
jgi:hypothetical protein